jgi:hypothetical protein
LQISYLPGYPHWRQPIEIAHSSTVSSVW